MKTYHGASTQILFTQLTAESAERAERRNPVGCHRPDIAANAAANATNSAVHSYV
jgi:hypothetical protein